jgi:hypothetical protein
LRYSSKIVTVSAVPPRERIGAKNSTCTRFGKGFSALLVAEMPFFQGFFVSGRRSERCAALERARSSVRVSRADAPTFVAVSDVRACFATATLMLGRAHTCERPKDGAEQPAKTTPFAGGNAANVRKSAGPFGPQATFAD